MSMVRTPSDRGEIPASSPHCEGPLHLNHNVKARPTSPKCEESLSVPREDSISVLTVKDSLRSTCKAIHAPSPVKPQSPPSCEDKLSIPYEDGLSAPSEETTSSTPPYEETSPYYPPYEGPINIIPM